MCIGRQFIGFFFSLISQDNCLTTIQLNSIPHRIIIIWFSATAKAAVDAEKKNSGNNFKLYCGLNHINFPSGKIQFNFALPVNKHNNLN